MVFGRLPRLPSHEPLREADVLPNHNNYVVDLVTQIIKIQQMAYDNLIAAKFKSKNHFNRKINEQIFKVEEFVFLLSGPTPKKFGKHYCGPHKVLEVISSTSVRIAINMGSKIVHANKLRKSYIGRQKARETNENPGRKRRQVLVRIIHEPNLKT